MTKEEQERQGEAPAMSADPCLTDAEIRSKIQVEIQKHGERELLSRIHRAARKALAELPVGSEIDKFNPVGQRIVRRISTVVQTAATCNVAQLGWVVPEVGWIQAVTELYVALINNSDDDASKTCVTRCKDEYYKCMKENDCEYSWLCICCMPCSLQYSGCVFKCIIVTGTELFMA